LRLVAAGITMPYANERPAGQKIRANFKNLDTGISVDGNRKRPDPTICVGRRAARSVIVDRQLAAA